MIGTCKHCHKQRELSSRNQCKVCGYTHQFETWGKGITVAAAPGQESLTNPDVLVTIPNDDGTVRTLVLT